jgi:N-methylhydantoinase B
VIEAFGDDIHEGDVFAINDPYLGGTHFNDVRIIRPIFHDGEIIACAQSNGHWADVGGTVPGSFDVTRRSTSARASGSRRADLGQRPLLGDVVALIVSNTRAPTTRGRLHAQAEATRVAEREILRLVDKYGRDTIVTAFARCRTTSSGSRARASPSCPTATGRPRTTSTRPAQGEGLVPIKVKLTIEGDQLLRPLGLAPAVGSFLNCRLRRALLGRRRRDEDVLPGRAAELGLLPRVDVDLGPAGSSSTRRGRSP